MSGRKSRNKGKRGEREFLNKLGDLLGVRLERNLNQSDKGGCDCVAVAGYAIEVKRCESLRRISWWNQAVNQAREANLIPVLAYRRNGQSWVVCLPPAHNRYVHFKEIEQVNIETFAARIQGARAA